jgi:hypothetical protein
MLLAACDAGGGTAAPENGKPPGTIVRDAEAALGGVLSVHVHYHWEGDGPTVDQKFVVTPVGSSPAPQPTDCVTLPAFVRSLDFETGAKQTGLKVIAGQAVIVLANSTVWELDVLNSTPAYPIQLSYITGHGRATYSFSNFDVPFAVAPPAAGCPPPTPTPPDTAGHADITLSGGVVGMLSGAAICEAREITVAHPTGSVTRNGAPEPNPPILNLYLDIGPPYQLALRFPADDYEGGATADHVTGPMLRAHVAAMLTDSAGTNVQLSATISCDGLPPAAIKGSG